MSDFIYVIAASETGPVKIGLSNDPERRLRQLQTGHADTLRIWHTEPISGGRVRLFERVIHDQVRHRRKRGEWFDLSVADAVAEIRFALIRWEDEPGLAAKLPMIRAGVLR